MQVPDTRVTCRSYWQNKIIIRTLLRPASAPHTRHSPLTSLAEGRQPVTLVGGASRKGAAGDQAEPSGADAPVAHLLVRRLRPRPRQPQARAASGPALGALRPLCEELADGPDDTGTRKRGPKLSQTGRSGKSRKRSAARRAPHHKGAHASGGVDGCASRCSVPSLFFQTGRATN